MSEYKPDGQPDVIHLGSHPDSPGGRRWFTVDGLRWVLSGGNAYGGNEGWSYEATAYDSPWGDITADLGFTFEDVRREGRRDVREAIGHAAREEIMS
jgi:hypothetical protein